MNGKDSTKSLFVTMMGQKNIDRKQVTTVTGETCKRATVTGDR